MTTLVAPLLVSAALLLAACGDSDSSSGGGGTTTPTTAGAEGGASSSQGRDQAVKFAQCMRENGVPDFPDPEADGRTILRAGQGDVDPNSAAFRSAQKNCQALAPSGTQAGGGNEQEMKAKVLEFAKCMRKNGVPDFPDPEVSGGSVLSRPGAGVDPNSPAFTKAQAKCGPLINGGAAGTTP